MSDGTAAPPERPNGERRRRRNPEQTRKAIVDALLAAIKEGSFVPTAKDIAERAGISERSIFVHFPGREDLRVAAVDAQSELVESLVATTDPGLPLEQRIAAVVKQSETVFAHQRNPRLLGLLESQSIAAIDTRMRLTDSKIRAGLARIFTTELNRSGAEDRELLDLIETTVGWAYRHQLMDRRGLSQRAASHAVTRALRTLLSGNTSRNTDAKAADPAGIGG
ncbi:TetR family transcriptional regulator [Nocardia sp. SYP-A9097]|uniref:TetR/AcrR family transcriptional regulator n=1 Tax=Nocardia sp. SYP-A9097 TaxID=2663237 RepID=UPI00129A475B|nr:TetR/AcrR family transcriptional regulator [Nocardia sp. SYP-A9097]MRH88224.1 TetR family transcriptional regulator [Nocardia sp. SYP-A9097]